MSKIARIVALLMCCVLLLLPLVSCGDEEIKKALEYLDTHERPKEKEYVNLNMYIPCSFDPEDPSMVNVIRDMQNEFNLQIEEKFRTRVIFKFIKESEYNKKIAEQRDYALEKKDVVIVNEPKSELDKFPEYKDFQLDIFVATGEAMVMDFFSKNAIFVSNLLSTTYYSKFCKENIPTHLDPVIYKNSLFKIDEYEFGYGVPANFLIGDYSYCFIKRSAADELFFATTTGTVSERIKSLQQNIAKANDEIIANGSERPLYVENEIIFYGDSSSELINNPDYYQLVVQNPQLTADDIYNGMFCIASTCRAPDRALEVISELYNNIDLHSTLQYGVKEVTYRLVKNNKGEVTGVVPVEGRPAYSLNPRYTGNIAMLYTCDDIELSGGEFALTREYLDRVFNQNKDAEFVKGLG